MFRLFQRIAVDCRNLAVSAALFLEYLALETAMIRRRDLLLQAAGTTALLATSGTAVGATPGAPPSLLRQLIPQPTGRNGYEELLAAVDSFQSSRYFQKAQQPDLTLEAKREIVADRPIVRALALLRQGLEKPIVSPHTELTAQTLFPELSQFRGLARLLALQQYVYLAEGRTPEALTNAWLGMRFGRAIQVDTAIAGLVGIAIGTVCLTPLSRHLDQLSTRDCNALFSLCREWLAQPNPQEGIMMGEFRFAKSSMRMLRNNALKNLPGAREDLGLGEEGAHLLAQIPKTPAEINAVFDTVDQRLDQEFQRVFEQLRRPPWQRMKLKPSNGNDLASQMAGLLLPAYHQIDNAYLRESARVRMLACHASIRRYRWEYDHLPGALSEVRLESLAVDPFTGEPFRYQVRGSRYTLVSAGPISEQPDDPRAVDGRIPVSITPDD